MADTYNDRVQIFDSSWKHIGTLGTGKATSENNGFDHPSNVFVDSKGRIYVTDMWNHHVQIFPSLDEIEAADQKRKEEAAQFLSQKPEIPAAPEPANKEPSARDRFKIIWDDASRFIP